MAAFDLPRLGSPDEASEEDADSGYIRIPPIVCHTDVTLPISRKMTDIQVDPDRRRPSLLPLPRRELQPNSHEYHPTHSNRRGHGLCSRLNHHHRPQALPQTFPHGRHRQHRRRNGVWVVLRLSLRSTSRYIHAHFRCKEQKGNRANNNYISELR